MADVVNLISNKMNVSHELLLSGVFKIITNYADFDFRKEIQQIESYIGLNVIYGSTWLKKNLGNYSAIKNVKIIL